MSQQSSSTTLPPITLINNTIILPPLPSNQPKYEFKINGHFPSQFNQIQSQCYHPSQQVLILGGSNGHLYFIGGDVHYYISLSDEYSIENIQVDEQFPLIYCLCKNHNNQNTILISFDYLKKQIINQVHFNQQILDIKYYKNYLLLSILDTSNNIPYIKYMSTSNFKFIQPITLLHPMFNTPNMAIPNNLLINSIEPHPQYDHVISVGYSNGDTVIYYIYHIQNNTNASIVTNLNCIVIPFNIQVTCLNWHTSNILICGYNDGSFTLYEINHPSFTFSKYYEMNMLKGKCNFISSFNEFIIFGLGSQNQCVEKELDSGIYYLKMNCQVKNIEFIRHVWCEQQSIHNIIVLKSVFDNPSSNSLMASVIYGNDRNILVLDLLEKMNYPQKELQLFNLEKYNVPTPFYSVKDLISNNNQFVMLKTSGMNISNLIYNNSINNYNHEVYRKNIIEYYLRPVNRWNILGMKYTQYRVDINIDKDNYIIAKLSDSTSGLGSAVEIYLCNTYFNDIRYIYTIGNQTNYTVLSKWSESVLVLGTSDGNIDFLHIPSATIFTHDITEKTPTIDNTQNLAQDKGNNFQSIISQIAKYNFKTLQFSSENPIIKLYPIQIINQLLIFYQDGSIKVVSLNTNDISSEQIIENEIYKHFGSVIFELLPSDMKHNSSTSSSVFSKSILPKKDIVTHVECSIYRSNLYAFIGYNSGKVILLQLYDLDYMTKSQHKLNKYIHENRWKDLSDHISPFIIYEHSANSFGKIIDIYTLNDIYNVYNISKMNDEKYLPPILRNEYVPNSLINQINSPICYTMYSNSLTSVFGTCKNNSIVFPINATNPLTILFQLKKSIPISFNFTLDILDIKFETLSKIDQIASYRIIINGIPFEFDIGNNNKIVECAQLAIVVSADEYRIYVRREESKFECIGSAPSGVNCIQDQYITKMNFKIISHTIHDRESEQSENELMNSKMYNLCDVDYLCEYIENVEIYNNLTFADIQSTKMKQPNIIGFISKSGIPPLGQPHHNTRSKYIIVVKEKGIEEYILEKPMISLKKFSIKEGRRYNHSNIIVSSSMEYLRSKSQSILLLDNQNNLMIFSPKPINAQSKSFEKIHSQKINNLPIKSSTSNYKLSSFDNGRDVFIYNNDGIYFGTLFDSKYHKSMDILEPMVYTIDYKAPTKAVGESIIGFFKNITKATPNDKDLNETFWKICSQLQREDLNIVKLIINNLKDTTVPQSNSQFDENEKTIISSFLTKELELKSKPNNKQSTSSGVDQQQGTPTTSNNVQGSSSASSSNGNIYNKTNRELLFGDDEKDETVKITSSSSSMKRSELNNRLEETKLQMSENLRKLDERGEKLRQVNEKTSELSNMAKSFGSNAQKLNQKSGFFGF